MPARGRETTMSADRFLVNLPQHILDDLQERLGRTAGRTRSTTAGHSEQIRRSCARSSNTGSVRSTGAARKRRSTGDPSSDEPRYVDATTKWQQKQGAYALIQGTRPYTVSGTIGSSFLPYADFVSAGALTWAAGAFKQWVGSTEVPAAFAMFPRDL